MALLPACGHGASPTTTTYGDGAACDRHDLQTANASAYGRARRLGYDSLHCMSSAADTIRTGAARARQDWRLRGVLGSAGERQPGYPRNSGGSMHSSRRGKCVQLCSRLDCCEQSGSDGNYAMRGAHGTSYHRDRNGSNSTSESVASWRETINLRILCPKRVSLLTATVICVARGNSCLVNTCQ